MTILLVECESESARFIKRGLEIEHYVVEWVQSGKEALKKTEINDYDAIILELNLSDMDGIHACRKWRQEQGIGAPILILTSRNTTSDKIKGLDSGADDYMTKPFSFAELLAHIRALLRREKIVKPTKLKVADLVLDPASHEVYRGDREIHLTPKEYRLLDYMMRRAGRVCTRTMIGEHVWGYNFSVHDSNVVDVTASALRRKLDCGSRNKLLHTLRFVGYKLQDKNESSNYIFTKKK